MKRHPEQFSSEDTDDFMFKFSKATFLNIIFFIS